MYRRVLSVIALALWFAVHLGASEPQEGKVMVLIEPEHAQLFVDGNPSGEGSQLIRLPAGTHTLAVHNYGYASQSREVSVQPGKNPKVELYLKRAGADVTGPRGRIQIEGASRAAIFLNGKSPGYFVGHGDEFNNNFFSWQRLIVPPGTYQLTAVDTKSNKEIWSGPVTVEANQRVIVDVSKGGQQRVKKWSAGEDSKALPRSKHDLLGNTIVAVAPVSGEFKAEQTKLNCGDSTRLVWSSAETVDAQINDGSEHAKTLPPSGDLTVKPTKTTAYAFQALGPGGVLKSDSTVEVDPTVQANLEASPTDVTFRKIGDKVVKHTSSNLNWSTAHSDSVTLDPVSAVSPTGSQAVQPVPKQTSEGPVDETATYTLVAKNVCGGSETRTAAIHVTGSIEPIPKVPLASAFFPTGYPSQRYPQVGLVQSQQRALSEAANGFKAYLEYDPDAKLQILGYADERDSRPRNQALSERRVERVRQYLMSVGIPSEKIEVEAHGKDRPLSVAIVKSLEQENPTKRRMRDVQETVWTYNRRVDLLMIPKGAEPVVSIRFFPHNASDATVLKSPEWLNRRVVEKAQEEGKVQATVSSNRNPVGQK